MTLNFNEILGSTKLAYEEKAICEDVERHLEAFGAGEAFLIPTLPSQERYAKVLEQLAARFARLTLFPSIEDALKSEIRPGIVILVGAAPEDLRIAYGRLGAFKAEGLPVVQVAPGRRFVTAPPGWDGMGLTYNGMFKIASVYCSCLRPSLGAYCEFGVYDGRTFVLAGQTMAHCCGNFVAFDSYSGIRGALDDETTHYDDGDYSANVATLEHNIRFSGLDASRLRIIKGEFQDSLAGRSTVDDDIGPVSIAHIDVDIYEPALLALRYLTPGLSQGALLLFDDYDQIGARNDLGERRALAQWLSENPALSVEPYRNYAAFGRSFILHRSDGEHE